MTLLNFGGENEQCLYDHIQVLFRVFVVAVRHHPDENEERKGSLLSFINSPLGNFRPPASPALMLRSSIILPGKVSLRLVSGTQEMRYCHISPNKVSITWD